jgi:hypothetical protein
MINNNCCAKLVIILLIICSSASLLIASNKDQPNSFQPIIGSWMRIGYGGGCVLDIDNIDPLGNMTITYTPPASGRARVIQAIAKNKDGKINIVIKVVHPKYGELIYELIYDESSNQLKGKDNLVLEEIFSSKLSPNQTSIKAE